MENKESGSTALAPITSVKEPVDEGQTICDAPHDWQIGRQKTTATKGLLRKLNS